MLDFQLVHFRVCCSWWDCLTVLKASEVFDGMPHYGLRWGQLSVLMSGVAQRGKEQIIAASLQALWLLWRSPAEPGCSLSSVPPRPRGVLTRTWLNSASPPSSAGMLVKWIRNVALMNVLTAINCCERDVFGKALCGCGDMGGCDVWWSRICSHCTEHLFVHDYVPVHLRLVSLYSARCILSVLCLRQVGFWQDEDRALCWCIL